MISVASGGKQFAIEISHDPANVGVKLIFDLRCDKPKPVLSREDNVEIAAEESLSHCMLVPYRDGIIFTPVIVGLPPTLLTMSPLGTVFGDRVKLFHRRTVILCNKLNLFALRLELFGLRFKPFGLRTELFKLQLKLFGPREALLRFVSNFLVFV